MDLFDTRAQPDLPETARADLPQVLAAGAQLLTGAGPVDLLARAGSCDALCVADSSWLPNVPALLRPGGMQLALEGELMGAASFLVAGRSAAVTIYETLQEGLS